MPVPMGALMTDYDAINARLLAERNAREAARRAQETQPEDSLEPRRKKVRYLLDRIETMAADFHAWWSYRDFDEPPNRSGKMYVHWLTEDGTERLAYQIASVVFDNRSNWHQPPEHSGVYLTIDGRLIRYISERSYWYNYWEDKLFELPSEQSAFRSYAEREITDYDHSTREKRLKSAEWLVGLVHDRLASGAYER